MIIAIQLQFIDRNRRHCRVESFKALPDIITHSVEEIWGNRKVFYRHGILQTEVRCVLPKSKANMWLAAVTQEAQAKLAGEPPEPNLMRHLTMFQNCLVYGWKNGRMMRGEVWMYIKETLPHKPKGWDAELQRGYIALVEDICTYYTKGWRLLRTASRPGSLVHVGIGFPGRAQRRQVPWPAGSLKRIRGIVKRGFFLGFILDICEYVLQHICQMSS